MVKHSGSISLNEPRPQRARNLIFFLVNNIPTSLKTG